MCGGGGSAPPDYSAENREAYETETIKREAQAQTYNDQISQLNNQSLDVFNQGKDALGQLEGFNYTDWLNATNSAENTGGMQNYAGDIGKLDYSNQLNKLDSQTSTYQKTDQQEAYSYPTTYQTYEMIKPGGFVQSSTYNFATGQTEITRTWQDAEYGWVTHNSTETAYRNNPDKAAEKTTLDSLQSSASNYANQTSSGGYHSNLYDGSAAWTDLVQGDAFDLGDLRAGYNQMSGQFDTINNTYNGIARPEFTPTVWGYDKSISVGAPSLIDYQGTGYATQLSDKYDSTYNLLSGYDDQTAQYQDELKNQYGSIADQFNNLASRTNQLDINSIQNGATALRGDISNTLNGMNAYSNEYYDWLKSSGQAFEHNGQTYADYKNQYSNQYQTLLNQLTDLEKARENELSRVDDFRSGMRGSLNQLDDQLDDMTLSGWGTSGDSYEDQLKDLSRQLGSFETDLAGQDFNYSQQLLADLQQQAGSLDTRYTTETNRNKDYSDSLYNTLDGYSTNIGGLNYSNLNQINQHQSALDTLQRQMGRYDSELATDFTGQQDYMSQLRDQLTGLLDERASEEERLAAFMASRQGDIGTLSTDIDGTSINNPDDIDALRDRYFGLLDQFGGYNTLLDTDFSTLQNQLGRELGDINTLQGERESALFDLAGRINQLDGNTDNLESSYNRLLSGVDGLDYRDLNSLTDYRNKIGDSQDVKGDYAALLDTLRNEADTLNFGSTAGLDAISSDLGGLTGYGDVLTQLDEMQGKRTGELDELRSQLATANSGIDGTEIQQEDDLNNFLSDLNNRLSTLSSYAGGDINALTQGYTDAVGEVNGKLEQLQAKRAELEQQAQQLLSRSNDAQYYNLDLVDGDNTAMTDLQSSVEFYNAQQAMDELDAISSRLLSERQRIEADLQQAEYAASMEAQQANIVPFDPVVSRNTDGLSNEEYLALLAARKNREELGGFASAFLTGLGG